MKTHIMTEIRKHGFELVMERAIEEALNGPKHLFLSVDTDVLDPSHAPRIPIRWGTGNAV
jgi:agmatinase